MTCVLGRSLTEAVNRFEKQGLVVRTIELRSKKGVPGGEARVVRQQLAENGQMLLTYAWFITKPNIPK